MFWLMLFESSILPMARKAFMLPKTAKALASSMDENSNFFISRKNLITNVVIIYFHPSIFISKMLEMHNF